MKLTQKKPIADRRVTRHQLNNSNALIQAPGKPPALRFETSQAPMHRRLTP